jgi:integrase
MMPEPAVPAKLPPHVKEVRSREGRPYYYLTPHRGTKREGARVRLPDDPKSPEFWAEYARHMSLPVPRENTRAVRALDRAWGESPEWAALSDKTKREWTRYRRRILDAWGDLEVSGIAPKNVMTLRNQWADTPAAANNLLRCLSSMLGWSVPMGWRADNPCREIKLLRGGDGYAPWPWAVIQAAERELRRRGRVDLWWSIGLALYTGQRQADVLAMKWSAATNGQVRVKQGKTGKELDILQHRALAALLDEIPRRSVYILTSSEGTPWQGGFGASWKKNRPSLVGRLGLVFHGLRKSAVVMLLEAGATEAETAAVTGQSLAMVMHYAKQVNQRKLASSAILKWEAAGTGTEQDLGKQIGKHRP